MVSTLKQEIEQRLLNRQVFSKRLDDNRFVTRCPNCGDSKKNPDIGHLYLRLNVSDNYPILYNCFKCPFSGILNSEVLEMMGIRDEAFLDGVDKYNKSADSVTRLKNDSDDVRYEYILPEIKNTKKIEYLTNRLGIYLEPEDYTRLGIIVSLREFLMVNKIKEISMPKSICKKLEDKYLGFISANHACIMFRDVTGTEKEFTWVKYKINPTALSNGRLFYSIPTFVNTTSYDKIIINLAEGIMDTISVAYNLDNLSDNIINIAVLGKKYMGTIKHIIQLGIFGSNVILNIYSDNDGNDDTKIEYYRKAFSDIKYLFGEFNVYYNLRSKDCGVPKDKILLEKYKI